jgi:hypothetical protein
VQATSADTASLIDGRSIGSTPECADDLARSVDADRRGQDRQIDAGGAESRELFSAA